MTVQGDYAARDRKQRRNVRIIGALLVVASIVLTGLQIGWNLYVQSWPTVNGLVTSSRVTGGTGDDDYSLYVEYDYTVNGQKYTGTYTKSSNTRPSAYSEKSSITVYYNPSLPQFSAINPGFIFGPLLFGVCCFFPFGLLIFAMGFLPDQKPVDLGKMRKIN